MRRVGLGIADVGLALALSVAKSIARRSKQVSGTIGHRQLPIQASDTPSVSKNKKPKGVSKRQYKRQRVLALKARQTEAMLEES